MCRMTSWITEGAILPNASAVAVVWRQEYGFQVPGPTTGQSGVEGPVEAVSGHAQHISNPAVGMLAEIQEHRRDQLRENDGGFFPLFRFQSTPTDLVCVPVNHIFFESE